MNLNVIGPRVFVRPDTLPEMSSDGLLHLVYGRQTSTMTGLVVAVGDGPLLAQEAVQDALEAVQSRITDPDALRAVQEVLSAYKAGNTVEPGDRVLFSPNAGEELIFEKDVLVAMKEDDILAVIE